MWLWDNERLRVVWANRPAVEAFAAETLFDVLDLRFEASEPGVREIARLAGALSSETPASARLTLQAFRDGQPFHARLQPHPLPDGRGGVVIAARGADAADQREALRIAALDALPTPVAVVNREGEIIDANREAAALLGRDGAALTGESLAKLMGETAGLSRLVQEVARTGIANRVIDANTRFGVRTLRLIARRLDAEGDAVVVTIDDITERRALERELDRTRAGETPFPLGRPPVRPLAREEEEAFNRLGAALRAATPAVGEPAPALPKPPAPEPAARPAAPEPAAGSAAAPAPGPAGPDAAPRPPETPSPGEPARRKADGEPAGVHVPEIIKRSLDLSPIATVLFQDRTLLYANKAALKLLGVEDVRELPEPARLVDSLSASSPGEPARIDGEGGAIEMMVRLTSFPFTTGPATKAELLQPRGKDAGEASRPSQAPRPQPLKAAAPSEADTAPLQAPPATGPAAAPAPAAAERGRDQPGPSADELISILDTATDGIATLDETGNILSLSAGAEAIFGLRQAEVLGQPIAALVQGDGARLVRDYLAALGESGIAAVFNDGLEVQARNAQGGSIPIFLTIGAIGADRNGREGRKGATGRAAYCAVFRDITQWKQTEAELRAAKEEAERASAQKSDFLARISHELRTPLNAILGFSEVMRTERFGAIANQKYLGYANDIHTSGEYLLSLINDLLDLSRIETGKLELNYTAVSLSELADHCLRLFEEDARARRIVVRKNFPPNLPAVVADLRSMKQVLLNLVSNAIKFTPPGGQVILSGQLTAGGEFSLKVKDTGIGMAEEELAVAMQPFGRIHAEERPDIPGTGLGLPLTKALVEANRGRFTLTSSRGKGTLAEITFPVNRVLGG